MPTTPGTTSTQVYSNFSRTDDCEIWDQLDDHSKSIILAPSGKPPPNQARKINMHKVSAYDYLMANFHLSMEDLDGGPSHIQSELPDPTPSDDVGASD